MKYLKSPIGLKVIGLFLIFCLAVPLLAQETIQIKVENLFGSTGSMTYSPDKKYALKIFQRSGILIWNLEQGKLERFTGNKGLDIRLITFNPDGKTFVTYSSITGIGGELLCWDFKTGKIIKEYHCDLASVREIVFSRDGKKMLLPGEYRYENNVNVSYNGLLLMDVETGNVLFQIKGGEGWSRNRGLSQAAIHPDGKRILLADSGNELKLIDSESGKILQNFHADFENIEDVVITEDGKYGIVTYLSGSTRIWDLESFLCVRTLVNPKHADYKEGKEIAAASEVVVSPDGEKILTENWDHYLRLWDMKSGELLKEIRTSDYPSDISFSSDGRRVTCNTHGIECWDLISGIRIFKAALLQEGEWVFATYKGYFNGSANAKKFIKAVVNGKEKSINKYVSHYMSPDKVVETLNAKDEETRLAFKKTDKQSSDSDDQYAQYARSLPVDFEPVIQQGHLQECKVWFDPTGQRVISSTGFDGEIKVWSLKTGTLLKTFNKQMINKESVGTVRAISPDGNLLVSSFLKEVLVWDLVSFELLKTFKVTDSDEVKQVAFHANGKEIVTDGSRIWTARTGEFIRMATGDDDWFQLDRPDSEATMDKDTQILTYGNKSLWTGSLPSKELTDACQERRLNMKYYEDGHILAFPVNNSIFLADLNTGKILRKLEGKHPASVPFGVHPDGKSLLLSGRGGHVDLLPFETFHFKSSPTGYPDQIGEFVFDPTGRFIVSTRSPIKIWDRLQKKWTGTIQPEVYPQISKDQWPDHFLKGFDPKNNGLVTCYEDKTDASEDKWDPRMVKWSLETGKKLRTGGKNRYYGTGGPWASDLSGKYMATAMYEDIELWNVNTMSKIHSVDLPWQFSKYYEMKSFAFNSTGTLFAAGGQDAKIRIWTTQGKGSVFKGKNPPVKYLLSGHWWSVTAMAFDPTGQTLVSGDAFGNVILWDMKTGSQKKKLLGHSGMISQVAFSKDGNYIFTRGGADGVLNMWRADNYERVSILISGEDWIMFTPDGFFDASRNGGDLIRLRKELTSFGVDQFALRTNRPDIIMKRMGIGSEETIQHYYAMFQRRLRRSGFSEEKLSEKFEVPEAEIIKTQQQGKFVNLQFQLKDDLYKIRRYNIFINDVPLFGGYGKEVDGKHMKIDERVELTSGDNKIEVSCFNEIGAESFRSLVSVEYKEEVIPHLYYLGFGVSQYRKADLNLNYAHKDALDLAKAFEGYSGRFGKINVKTFTDDQVTVQNIRDAKAFLKNARVDDIFILFIAGHGMYSQGEDATYYYLTYNADPMNLSQTAANFDLIEDLLQGIKPRKKLFLMDTCESGEVEEEAQNTFYAMADARGIKARTTRGVAITQRKEKSKRSYLYQKDRFIYNDLIRRSGAIVFSSSRGGELSYESDAVQNGLFTEEIINCITKGYGDMNRDGVVTTDELRVHVSKAVAQATDNAQHPTVDRDNIYQKFGFPVK